MLSKQSVKLLRWLRRNDAWLSRYAIEQQYGEIDFRSFRALIDNGYLISMVPMDAIPEYDEYGGIDYPEEYRISDSGRSYLESLAANRWREFRNWFSLAVALAAFIKSFFF